MNHTPTRVLINNERLLALGFTYATGSYRKGLLAVQRVAPMLYSVSYDSVFLVYTESMHELKKVYFDKTGLQLNDRSTSPSAG